MFSIVLSCFIVLVICIILVIIIIIIKSKQPNGSLIDIIIGMQDKKNMIFES